MKNAKDANKPEKEEDNDQAQDGSNRRNHAVNALNISIQLDLKSQFHFCLKIGLDTSRHTCFNFLQFG